MNARVVVGAVVGGLTLGLGLVGRAQAPAPPPPVAQPVAAAALAPTVKITLITVPVQKRVFVYWGKKRLGVIAPHQPLILQRPRDSGPLDLIIQCEGFVPVQTRAYTFGDTKVAVRLTPLDQKNTLIGYREEVPPPPPPDAGAPPSAATPPPGVAAPPSNAATPAPGVAATPAPGVAAPPPNAAPPRPGVAAPGRAPDAGAR
jgi:hypothetical protein